MRNKVEHTTIRNNDLFCLNCGKSQKMPYPIDVDMFAARTKQFNISHKNCLPEWKESETDQSLTVGDKADFWFNHGEKGRSSECIYQKLRNNFVAFSGNRHPLDPDDFKRCYKLLKAVPEWKERLREMDSVSPVWKNLVENWNKLTEMYEQNVAENWKNYKTIGMYEFMKSLGC